MRNQRLWTAALAVVAFTAGMWCIVAHRSPSSGGSAIEIQANSRQALVVTTESVENLNVPRWLDVTGTVRMELEAPIGTKVAGRIVAVRVREGDSVRRGQPLIELDARDFDASIGQANANVRAAIVGRDAAKVAAGMEISLSEARIDDAQARLEQSEAALKAAGAKLDLLRTGPRKQERAQAVLAVIQAKSSLALADGNLKRMQSLVDEGAISRQYFDTIRTQYEVAKAQYESAREAQSLTEEGTRQEEIRAAEQSQRQAQAEVNQSRAGLAKARAEAQQINVRNQEIRSAEAQISQSNAAVEFARVTRDYATITAPFDGIVAAKLTDPGAMAGPGTPLLKIQGGRVRLEAVVPESSLGYANLGKEIEVRLDAIPGRTLPGKVSEITPQGDAASHTFIVKIDLPNDAGARSGMFGRARLKTGVERRLTVPATAVWEREGLHYVYVVDAQNSARLRMVTVGDPDAGRLPILSGLNSGERIAANGREQLFDGARVRNR